MRPAEVVRRSDERGDHRESEEADGEATEQTGAEHSSPPVDQTGQCSEAVCPVVLQPRLAAFPLVRRAVAALASMSCNRSGSSCVSSGMEHDPSDREGLDHGRLQLLLFGAALGPLLLTMALLFVT